MFGENTGNESTQSSSAMVLSSGFDNAVVLGSTNMENRFRDALGFDATKPSEEAIYTNAEGAGNLRAMAELAKRESKARLELAKSAVAVRGIALNHHTAAMKLENTFQKQSAKFLETASLAIIDGNIQQQNYAGFSKFCGQAEQYLNW